MVRSSLTIVALFLTVSAASAECLSYSEARSRWPKRHLYWHTSERCWDATSGSRWRSRYRGEVRRGPRSEAAVAAADNVQTPAAPPPLSIPLPRPAPRRYWREPDLSECCWPPLKDLLPDLSSHTKGEPK